MGKGACWGLPCPQPDVLNAPWEVFTGRSEGVSVCVTSRAIISYGCRHGGRGGSWMFKRCGFAAVAESVQVDVTSS